MSVRVGKRYADEALVVVVGLGDEGGEDDADDVDNVGQLMVVLVTWGLLSREVSAFSAMTVVISLLLV